MGDDYGVLEILAQAPHDYLEEGAIADQVGLKKLEVQESIRILRRLGLPVESHPVFGHRLSISYDLIDRKRLSDELENRGLSCDVKGLLEVESTNDLANAATNSTAPNGTIFFTEYQSRGRGRLGRKWHSPVGSGLWFSILQKHDLPIEQGWRVTLGAGIAVARAISCLTELDPVLKWPNDVQIQGRKVAGILTESRSSRSRLKNSTIGIGVNVHVAESDFPVEFRDTATSVQAAGAYVKRVDLLGEILVQLNDVSNWSTTDLLSSWRGKCSQWGHRVLVEWDQGTTEGVAIDLADDGAFVIEDDDGIRFSVHSGEVTHLRTIT